MDEMSPWILFPGGGMEKASFEPKKEIVLEDEGYLLQFIKR